MMRNSLTHNARLLCVGGDFETQIYQTLIT